MAGNLLEALSFDGTPIEYTTGAASALSATPKNADGGWPKYVLVSIAAGNAYFRMGTGGDTIATGEGTLICAGQSLIVKSAGHFRVVRIQETAPADFTVSPLGNQ